MTKFELKLLLPHCSTLISKLIFFFNCHIFVGFLNNGTYKKTKNALLHSNCADRLRLQRWLTTNPQNERQVQVLNAVSFENWRRRRRSHSIYLHAGFVDTGLPKMYIDGKNRVGEKLQQVEFCMEGEFDCQTRRRGGYCCCEWCKWWLFK